MTTKRTITPAEAGDLVAISAEHAANGEGRLGSRAVAGGITGTYCQRLIVAAAELTLVDKGVATELLIRSVEHGTTAVYLHPEAERILAAKHP